MPPVSLVSDPLGKYFWHETPGLGEGTRRRVPSAQTGTYRRDKLSSLSWLWELSAPTEVAPAGSSLNLSITSRPLSSAICWIRLSTCSWGVVSVIAEPMESSITWCVMARVNICPHLTRWTLNHPCGKYSQTLKCAATHWGVNIEALDLTLKLVHDCRDLLEIHGFQSFVQGLCHLAHIFADLMEKLPLWGTASI